MSAVGLCCLLFLSVSVCYWVPAGCYANGKVTKACGSMVPHHGSHSNSSHSPYHLATNATKFNPGDSIQVILSGTSYFEGFLLEARDAANQSSVSAVGSFTLTNSSRTQLLTCNNLKGSAVSHTSDARQREVVVIWNAPKDAPSVVQFLVTVVAHYSVFWVKLPGPIIYQHGVTPLPPHSTTVPTTVQTTTPSILPGPFTSAGCGQSKSCLLDPPGCNPQDPHCFFLSMTTEGADKTSVLFELSGPAEGYLAFALSWDTWMGNDDMYMCVKDRDGVSVSAAFVSGRTHPEDQSQSSLSLVSWRLADGGIQCSFSRPVKLTNLEPERYDLDQEYFLFLANGHAQY
uniref:putative ferric-chelate reductase 1 n=1 Tax=Centroberyx gerrardi TaxID=166262 RepID=UPI003AAEC462